MNFSKTAYITCVLVILFSAQAALAVTLVPKGVPRSNTLQPLPDDAMPNYQESIGVDPLKTEEQEANENENEPNTEPQDSQEGTQAQNSANSIGTSAPSKSSIFWWIVIIAIILIGGLEGYQKFAARRPPEKPQR